MTRAIATPPKNVSQLSTMEKCFNCGVDIRRETFNGGEPWLHGYKGYLNCERAYVFHQLGMLIDVAGAAAAFEKSDTHMDGYPKSNRTHDRIVTTEMLREFCVANRETICG